MQLIAVGGVGLDTVYVGDGSTVDATLLGASSDLIYLRGDWADYSKSLAGSVMTFSRSVNGHTETVKVIGGNGALNDKLVFADGAMLSNNPKHALSANLNGPSRRSLATIPTSPHWARAQRCKPAPWTT